MTARDIQNISNPEAAPPVEDWHDDPLPLEPVLGEAAAYPFDAFPASLRECAEVLQRTMQAPDGIIGSSLLAAASLAAQPHADVQLPHGAVSPLSLFFVTIAESGERKSAIDSLVLRPHNEFEKARHAEYAALLEAHRAKPKGEQDGASAPRQPIFTTGDPTIEGLIKMLVHTMPTVGIFSAEGGRFIGGYGMSEDAALRTAAGLSQLWDGSPLDRVRSGDGATKLYGRRVSLHLMAQPRAAMSWMSNPVLRDQGLFSRCLVAYPASTAGTRLFRDEKAVETPAFIAYCAAISALLEKEWVTNDMGELTPRTLALAKPARDRWINLHNEIEVAIPNEYAGLRGLASKAAEHAARIAGVLELVRNPSAATVTLKAMESAATILKWYLGEAVRLSGVQPVKEGIDRAVLLWEWLGRRGKRQACLAELLQFGPNKLRTAKVMRETVAMLVDHYRARPLDGIEWNGKLRAEAWEFRL